MNEMGHNIMFIFFGLLAGSVVDGIVAPVYKWPLSDRTFGYEVINGFDAKTPKLNMCHPVNSNGNPYLSDKGTMKFDGSDNSYVDVALDGSVPFPYSLMFTMFVKPTEIKSRSVIFHYKSDYNEASKITEVLLEGYNNDYKSTLIYDNGMQSSVTVASTMALNVLKLIMVRHRYGDQMMSLTVDTIRSIENTFGKRLSLPGVVRFGGHQSDLGVNFIGELSCAEAFSTENNIASVSEVTYHCNTAYTKPPITPSCFSGSSDQLYIWPLDNKALGYEVKKGISPEFYYSVQYKFVTGPSSLTNDAVSWDGSFLSTLLTKIPQTAFQNDFEILMFIYFNSVNDGIILQLTNNTASGGINKFVLSVLNGLLTFKIYDSGLCGQIDATDQVVTNQWQTLAIQRQQNNIHLNIGTFQFTAVDTCSTHPHLSEKLTLAIGPLDNMMEGFKGGTRCMVMFNVIHSTAGVLPALNSACLSTEVTSFSKTLSNHVPAERSVKFMLMMSGSCPPIEVPAMEILSGISLTSCGRMCVRQNGCRTFSYTKTNYCKLYDCFILNQLVNCVGTNYYSIRSIF